VPQVYSPSKRFHSDSVCFTSLQCMACYLRESRDWLTENTQCNTEENRCVVRLTALHYLLVRHRSVRSLSSVCSAALLRVVCVGVDDVIFVVAFTRPLILCRATMHWPKRRWRFAV
jgi:hypothetical protein